MSNLNVALASFWQLTRHLKQGQAAKLEMSCDAGSLNIQLNAKLGHSFAPPCKRKSFFPTAPERAPVTCS